MLSFFINFSNSFVKITHLSSTQSFSDTRNHEAPYGLEPKMTLAKSYSTASLSRAAVDFLVNELQLESFMKDLEWREYGTNELFLGSLDTAEALA